VNGPMDSVRRRCPHFADQGEHLVFADQPLRVGNRQLRVVAVIVRNQIELAAMNPAGGVRLIERRQYSVPHSDAEGGCVPL
jgi:hypothetical protein